MLTTEDQDTGIQDETGAVVETPKPKAEKSKAKAIEVEEAVETIERPGSNTKLKAAVAYLALRLLDPSGVEDFKNLYPSVFE